MAEFAGFLFSKLFRIGTRSEGPEYFLQDLQQQENNLELEIKKQVELWQEDPRLQLFLGHKVTIRGELVDGQLNYELMHPYDRPEPLILQLQLEQDTLRLNKGHLPSRPLPFEIRLLVHWPYRSIWTGVVPTTQIYDFFVEQDGQVLWQWSCGQTFDPQETQVQILGGSPRPFPVVWMFDPDQIEAEGFYLIRGSFLASDQTVEKWLEIRFV